jgi:hypothetical protein
MATRHTPSVNPGIIQLALGNTNFSLLITLSNKIISRSFPRKVRAACSVRSSFCKEKQWTGRRFLGGQFFSRAVQESNSRLDQRPNAMAGRLLSDGSRPDPAMTF